MTFPYTWWKSEMVMGILGKGSDAVKYHFSSVEVQRSQSFLLSEVKFRQGWSVVASL